jgi:hypothetical protein
MQTATIVAQSYMSCAAIREMETQGRRVQRERFPSSRCFRGSVAPVHLERFDFRDRLRHTGVPNACQTRASSASPGNYAHYQGEFPSIPRVVAASQITFYLPGPPRLMHHLKTRTRPLRVHAVVMMCLPNRKRIDFVALRTARHTSPSGFYQ